MIRVFILCLVVIAAACGPVHTAERFVSVIEDLPLMDGLVENENAAVTFETAGGRIAEAEARGNVGPDSALKFYQSVLPQLGWTQLEAGLFQRDGERLKLVIEGDGKAGAVVGFSLSPRGK
ncbi:MAG: hypothetical protein NWR87_01255 [Rhodospirillales bacterium]|nr:hypothetical protein [Rhodospirillales bacterium]